MATRRLYIAIVLLFVSASFGMAAEVAREQFTTVRSFAAAASAVLSVERGVPLCLVASKRAWWSEGPEYLEVFAGDRDSAVARRAIDIDVVQIAALNDSVGLVLGTDRQRYTVAATNKRLDLWQPLPIEQGPAKAEKVSMVSSAKGGSVAFVLLDDALWMVSYRDGAIEARLWAQGAIGIAALRGTTPREARFAALLREGGVVRVVFINAAGGSVGRVDVPLANPREVRSVDGGAIAVLGEEENTTPVMIIDSRDASWFDLIPAPASSVALHRNPDGVLLAWYVQLGAEGYSMVVREIQQRRTDETRSEVLLPAALISPLHVGIHNDRVVAVFRTGMASFSSANELLSFDPLDVRMTESNTLVLQEWGRGLMMQAGSRVSLLRLDEVSGWQLRVAAEHLSRWGVPLLVALAVAVLWRRAREARRTLSMLFDVQGADVLIIVDSHARVKKLNNMAREVFDISSALPLGRDIRYYSGTAAAALEEFVREAVAARRFLTTKIIATKGDDDLHFSFFATPLRGFLGAFRGVILTGRNITRDLEMKKLNHWAQLAHDMQTNLSIIRLNAEQALRSSDPSMATSGRKILFQANVLVQRVRDLTTLGRSESIEKLPVSTLEICEAACIEFDESLFPKVRLEYDGRDTLFPCDKPKFVRALRNAVENAIRSLRDSTGEVTVETDYDDSWIYFRVKDNGIGMDEETQRKMFDPHYTRFKQHGGTGLGTMIMKHVVELHGGDIRVFSRRNEGTTIEFRFARTGVRRGADKRSAGTGRSRGAEA